MVLVSLMLALVAVASPVVADFSYGDGCLFDGRIYQKGEIIVIPKCLGQMECLGENRLGPIEPAKNCDSKRDVGGQTGCLFDGRVYAPGEIIVIPRCLGQMECLGHNALGPIGPAKNCDSKRDSDQPDGCLFDGHLYAIGEKITIPDCLAEYTCVDNNQLGHYKQLYGICPDQQN